MLISVRIWRKRINIRIIFFSCRTHNLSAPDLHDKQNSSYYKKKSLSNIHDPPTAQTIVSKMFFCFSFVFQPGCIAGGI
jgi:hypothetical protein